MSRRGYLFDMASCIGCMACQVACKEQNKLPVGEYFRRVSHVEIVQDGKSDWVNFSGACNHCADPLCIKVCPTEAMHKGQDGTVQHDKNKCIGCAKCVCSCPYGAPSISKITGYAQKCTACADRRGEGLEPACVAACVTGALRFGELSELSESGMEVSHATLPFLPPIEQTAPSLLLHKRGANEGKVDVSLQGEQKESEPTFKKDTDETFVVLGTGIAALSAAKAIRERNKTASIHMIGEEKGLPYARTMLSKSYLNSFSTKDFSLAEDDFYSKNNIELTTGIKATEIETKGKRVMLENGESISYDKLIYALGATSFIPPIAGKDKSGVFTMRTEADVIAIKKAMLRAESAVIIGGGITGLEIAWELKKSGMKVTVLDLADMLMGRILDKKSADALRSHVEGVGIEVMTGLGIKEILGESGVCGVSLEDGRVIDGDMVILSTGYKANTELAIKSGIKADRRVAVSPSMQTDNCDIYACGDCADLSGATWLQAISQGKVAGGNAAGDTLAFEVFPEPAMVHTAGTSLMSIGDMGKGEGSYSFVYGKKGEETKYTFVNEEGRYEGDTHYTFAFKEGKLVGITIVGRLSDMLFIEAAVENGLAKDEFLKSVTEKGVELDER